MQMVFPGCHLKLRREQQYDAVLALPITVDNVRRETQRDPVLSQVHQLVTKGWLNNHVPELDPFYLRRNEITVHSGCLMWGIRVIFPPPPLPNFVHKYLKNSIKDI